MAKTNILELNGLQAEMIMFSFVPRSTKRSSAARSMSASSATCRRYRSRSPMRRHGRGRQSVFRGSILATPKSGINELKDLKGKKLYGPVGSSIYLASVGMRRKPAEAGKDVEMVQGVRRPVGRDQGGKVDAVFVWDPWIELFVTRARQGAAKDTACNGDRMRNDYMQKNPDASRILRAHKAALAFAASDHRRANAWFASRKMRARWTRHRPDGDRVRSQWNAKAMRDIRISSTTRKWIATWPRQAGVRAEVFPKEPPLKEKTDMSAAKKLDESSWTFDLSKVKVK
jgi:ABC-type nitrate/sulfonate/bicarbonate transport system substrate-binding protein